MHPVAVPDAVRTRAQAATDLVINQLTWLAKLSGGVWWTR